MKLIKSLLLGAAAGVVGAASASAADLPAKTKGPAVEYVRICDTYGTGYFFIPGTDTCLKVFGTVRAEYIFGNTGNQFTTTGAATGTTRTSRDQNTTIFHSRLTIREDSRTQTSYGVLRTLAIAQLDTNNGANSESIDKAFIQWAGITAGRAQSFFDFYADDAGYSGIRNSDSSSDLLAYTAVFGGGFSATFSIEDPGTRRVGIANINTPPVGAFASATGVAYSGTRSPDFIAALRVDQTWGSAQLSGVAHQIVTQNQSTIAATTRGAETFGWAVQAGVKINLPALGPGDALFLEGAYGDGALAYTLGGGTTGAISGGVGNGAGINFAHGDAVAIPTATGYRLDKEQSWSVLAALEHYWTPTLRQDIYGSYAQISPSSASKNGGDWRLGYLGDYSEFRIATTIQWEPVKGFTIGVDGIYANVSNTLASAPGLAPSTTTLVTGGVATTFKKDYDSFAGRLRLNRSF